MNHGSQKYFDSNKGLDLQASDLNRNRRFASSMRNAQYTKQGATEKRRGFQKHSGNADGFGLFNYRYIDADDEPQQLAISVGEDVSKLLFTTISVDYSGSEAAAYLSLFYDTATGVYRCRIIEGTAEVLDLDLGVGYDELAPVTIADLKTAINALTGFAATVAGDDSVPAAFLRIIRDFDIKADTWVGKAGYWAEVNQSVNNPFSGSTTNKANADFENVSGVVLSNCLYLSNGYDYMQKYDGQNLYRAGLPIPLVPTSALGAAGTPNGSNYVHRIQYVQVDAAGNIIEGNITPVSTALNPANQKMDLVIPNVLAAAGFNTNAAIVAGAQATVNQITVDDGSGGTHTMVVGDTAYFYDGVSAGYVERAITAVDATTITVGGAAVTVADNAVISNNLRIKVQRNKTSGTTPTVFYEVVQLPNNPFTATQAYVDDLADASLGDLVIPPATDRSPPPKGKYLCTFQSLLIVLGNPADPFKFYWSDVDSPEYFPAGTNEERIESEKGEVLVGGGSTSSALALFTESSMTVLSGTLTDNNYRLELKPGIGCSAHASIVQAEGFLCWWSKRGPYLMSGGEKPQPLGASQSQDGNLVGRVAPLMDQEGYEFNPQFETLFRRGKRCIGFNWTAENKILFYLPCETVQSSERVPNTNTRVYAYDYSCDAWLEWSNLNMHGGVIQYFDEVFFKARRLNDSNNLVSDLHRFHNLSDAWDYQDNDEAVDWEYGPQWEALGEPGVLKKFLEILVFSLEDVANQAPNITVKQEINYQYGASAAEFDLSVEGAGYGQSQYDIDAYGDPVLGKFTHELAKARTYSMRPLFTNDEEQTNVILSGWELLYATPYRLEYKR